MRIVTKVEYIDIIDMDKFYQMAIFNKMIESYSSDSKYTKPIYAKTINIYGHSFIVNGKEVIIGWHPEVEALFTPLKCIENNEKRVLDSYKKGYNKGKNSIWDFLKFNGPDTDYWWLPALIFTFIGVLLA